MNPSVPANVLSGAAATRPTARLALLCGVLAMVFSVIAGLSFTTSASAATLVNQCNGTDNVGGQSVECTVTVDNHYDVTTGTGHSDLTVVDCHGAANAPPTCITTVTPNGPLVTSVTQCNGSGSGGGGEVLCHVFVTNTITGASTKAPVTVNECNSAGAEGTEPTIECNPSAASTTNATITQCNESGNGGGASRRVKCTATGTQDSAFAVTIDQCVGSGNGGGATVTCTASEINNLVSTTTSASATATTTTTPSATATTVPATGAPSTTRPRPSGTVRPTTTVRPTGTSTGTSTGTATRTSTGQLTQTATARSTTATKSTSAVAGTTVLSDTGSIARSTDTTTTRTALATTGTPVASELGLAGAFLAAGAAFMMLGRRPRWIGKHR